MSERGILDAAPNRKFGKRRMPSAVCVHIGFMAALGFLCMVSQSRPLQAQVFIRGFVRDADTGQGLTAATIRVADTFSGTIANDDGEYVLRLDGLPARLLVTCVGYRSQERTLADTSVADVDFRMDLVPYMVQEIIVDGVDPAVRIMRQVIENKEKWQRLLENYQVDVYSRWTIENDAGVVGVVELDSEIYWDRMRGTGEVVKAKRTTASVTPGGPFSHFGAADIFLNFYEDEIDFGGPRIIGPTHPRALHYYNFELLGQRRLDEQVVHDIAISPKSELQPAFAGTLAVLDREFALLEVALKANRVATAVPVPGVQRFDLAYRQQFRSFGGGMWLPVDFRIAIDLHFGMTGLHVPPMRRDIVQRLSNYQVNTALPDSLFSREDVEHPAPLAVGQDSLFSYFRDALPLSAAEREAYENIDSTLTVYGAFKPTGFLGRLIPEPPARADSSARKRAIPDLAPELGINRVDAVYLGLGVERKLRQPLVVSLKGGYSTGQKRWLHGGRISSRWGEERRMELGIEYRVGTQERYRSDNYPRWFNSLQILLDGKDYFDYYWNERLSFDLGIEFEDRDLSLGAQFNDEKHTSVDKSTRFDLLDRFGDARINPSIAAGDLRSAVFTLDYGKASRPWSFSGGHRHFELQIEHSGDVFGSDFSFTQYRLALDWHCNTFLARRSPPNAFDVRLIAGAASGDLPVQRFGALDASVGGFTPFGTFRSLRDLPYEGERYVGAFWEQYFRTVPFELLGLWPLVHKGMGLVVHGASGRTWISTDKRARLGYSPVSPTSFHHEVGISLILFHLARLDFVRRLDRPDWGVGLSLVRLDFAGPEDK